jgi:TolB protein
MHRRFLLTWVFLSLVPSLIAADASLGIFEGQSDIGAPAHAGTATFDPAHDSYLVTGGGSNMWFNRDSFHFIWKKVLGDVSLAADIAFAGTNGDPHRKACLIIRQNLAPDSAYADAALHGSGLTSLQYRETNGATTREIQANVSGPTRLRIEKRGKNIFISMALAGEKLHPAGGSFQMDFTEPFYIGLGVCAHNNNDSQTAIFSQVKISQDIIPTNQLHLASTLEIVAIGSKDRRVVYWATNHIEAPNWSRDGTFLLFNGGGHLYHLPLDGSAPQLVNTGFANRCNNDHGFSPDGLQLAISDQSQGHNSLIYLLPSDGGTPRRITTSGPSYWHGWSPDGKTLVFCGQRSGEFDVYSIPAAGGEETRLTTAPGLDDGPEFSPDGQFIYFNSERTGSMQIWRMLPDGSHQEQITDDDRNNWFAHISPDGKWMVYLSYDKSVKGHPENQDVILRLRPVNRGPTQDLAKLFGGQGTINVPSWSPDSTKIAFMSYQWLP